MIPCTCNMQHTTTSAQPSAAHDLDDLPNELCSLDYSSAAQRRVDRVAVADSH